MSRMSEMHVCVSELRSAAQWLCSVADTLERMFSGGSESDNTLSLPSQDAPFAEPSAPTPKPITLTQVRAVLAEKSRSGHTAAVRALLERHGAAKLSEIDSAEYDALLAEAEVLKDG